jgi:hypothetical protein
MARPKIEDFWEQAIRVLTENEPRLGPLGIQPKLAWLKERMEKKPEGLRVPSLRTIGRVQRQFRTLSEEERQPYRIFRWPESMEQGALPWEAAPAGLELLRFLHEKGQERPTIGTVRWFWRVSLIAPEARVDLREYAALCLNATETSRYTRASDIKRSVESWLAWAPWRSEASLAAYRAAAKRQEIPGFPPVLEFSKGDDVEGYLDAQEAMGFITTPGQRQWLREWIEGLFDERHEGGAQ